MSQIAREMRSKRRSWAAPGSAHDHFIRLLKPGLPAAIGALAAYLLVAPLLTTSEVSFLLDKKSVEVAHERLKIEAATYRGEDGKGQPFTLTADSAVQKSSAEPIVQLQTLAARIKLKDGPGQFHANHGRYNMTSEQVAIDGPVRFQAPDGYLLDTRDATIDLKTRQMHAETGVSGTVPQGTFSGQALKADLENHVVTLDGKARLRIVPRHAR